MLYFQAQMICRQCMCFDGLRVVDAHVTQHGMTYQGRAEKMEVMCLVVQKHVYIYQKNFVRNLCWMGMWQKKLGRLASFTEWKK